MQQVALARLVVVVVAEVVVVADVLGRVDLVVGLWPPQVVATQDLLERSSPDAKLARCLALVQVHNALNVVDGDVSKSLPLMNGQMGGIRDHALSGYTRQVAPRGDQRTYPFAELHVPRLRRHVVGRVSWPDRVRRSEWDPGRVRIVWSSRGLTRS